MTDTERIDALERLLWDGSVGNGIAIFPCTENKTGRRLVSLTDLGDEDGSNLGQELTETVPTLREAIDLAVSANAAGQGCEAYPAPACSQ
ncbi:MAG: hypothetical protein WCL44_08965, partial [bacterium]